MGVATVHCISEETEEETTIMNTSTCGVCHETVDLDHEIWLATMIEGRDTKTYFHKDCAILFWEQMDEYINSHPSVKAAIEAYRYPQGKPRAKRAKKQDYEMYNVRGKTIVVGDEIPTTDTIRKILAKSERMNRTR